MNDSAAIVSQPIGARFPRRVLARSGYAGPRTGGGRVDAAAPPALQVTDRTFTDPRRLGQLGLGQARGKANRPDPRAEMGCLLCYMPPNAPIVAVSVFCASPKSVGSRWPDILIPVASTRIVESMQSPRQTGRETAMSGQDNKTVVRRYYEEVFSQRRTGLIDQLA